MYTKSRQGVAWVAMGVLVLSVFASPSAARPVAEPSKEYARTDATPTEIVGDLFIARPAYLALTVLGAGMFAVSLPFTALGHKMDHAAQEMVIRPARYTFTYPLGTF
jgi:hypothetical protein